MCIIMRLLLLTVLLLVPHSPAFARRLTPKNIKKAIQQQAPAVNVDLSKFAGSEVSMSLFNLANGWADEAGYWASIKVVAE